MANKIEITKSLAEELLALLKVESPVVTVTEAEGLISVDIQSSDNELLIGHQGQTLSSLQLILGIMVYKKLGEWVKVIVNVGNYREIRQEEMVELALKLAEQVKASGEPVVCPVLNANDRRLVHLALQDNPDVVAESEGEPPYRRLLIKPKI